MRRFQNILCVVDPGEACGPALDRAFALAQGNRAELTVISVVEPTDVGVALPEGILVPGGLEATLLAERRAGLQALLEPYRARVEPRVEVLTGVPFLEIVREVLRNGRDLVIKTAEVGDWLQRLFGGDDMHLLRKCPCPVWLIKPDAPATFRRVLAAVDVGDAYPSAQLRARRAHNRYILELAGSLAVAQAAELHVVYAWYAIGESVMRGARAGATEEQVLDYLEQVRSKSRDALDALIAELRDTLGPEASASLAIERHLVKGGARKEVPALADRLGADLVVMGTVARTGIPGFIMGNTAETILNLIDCSVLAVKPPGFVTPVTLAD